MEPAPPTVFRNAKTCPSRSLISKCYKYFESALWPSRRISPIPIQSIALNLSWHVRIYLSFYFLPTYLRLCFCCQFYGVFICWQPLSVQLPWQLPRNFKSHSHSLPASFLARTLSRPKTHFAALGLKIKPHKSEDLLPSAQIEMESWVSCPTSGFMLHFKNQTLECGFLHSRAHHNCK